MYWFGAWPGRGPFSYLPPWMRPGWLYGRGACWWLFGPYAWQWGYIPFWFMPWYRPVPWMTPYTWW